MKSPIEDRLQASIKYDVIHGDEQERAVLGLQIQEAVYELRKLRHTVKKAEDALGLRTRLLTRILYKSQQRPYPAQAHHCDYRVLLEAIKQIADEALKGEIAEGYFKEAEHGFQHTKVFNAINATAGITEVKP